MATVFCLLTLMIIEVCVFIRPVLSIISTHWGPCDTYYMLWWTGTHWLRKCCINYFVSSHYVIQCWHYHLTNMNTSPSCQWTFIWKYNNSVSIIFFPSCCCDLRAVVPGLSSTSRLPRPPWEDDPAPVSPRLHERSISQWLMSDQCWSGGLGDIWFLYLFGGGNFLSHVIILTITRRETFGRLRSINPNMINHVAKQSPLLF